MRIVTDLAAPIRRPWRWHILVFLAPALIVYSALMIIPLAETLRLSLFTSKEQVVELRRLRQLRHAVRR